MKDALKETFAGNGYSGKAVFQMANNAGREAVKAYQKGNPDDLMKALVLATLGELMVDTALELGE